MSGGIAVTPPSNDDRHALYSPIVRFSMFCVRSDVRLVSWREVKDSTLRLLPPPGGKHVRLVRLEGLLPPFVIEGPDAAFKILLELC